MLHLQVVQGQIGRASPSQVVARRRASWPKVRSFSWRYHWSSGYGRGVSGILNTRSKSKADCEDGLPFCRFQVIAGKQGSPSGLYFAIDEVELVVGQNSRRRDNSFQTLRAMVDQNDEHLMPPSTCLYLAATPEMFEDPNLFPKYKALQDRIEDLPSLAGKKSINYRAPVVNLDKTELGAKDLRKLADKVVDVYTCANGEPDGDSVDRIDALVKAIAEGNYVIARPRLLCRCMVELLEGRLGDDLRQELAVKTEEMRKEREREIKGK